MQENSLQSGQRLQGNPLESHLRTFVTSLLEDGYADATVVKKVHGCGVATWTAL
jgi:hypothetical protein